MGNRTRDRVIYIHADEKLQTEFEKQKEASGYSSNADFVDYLLRINEGKQISGIMLKEMRELLAGLWAELKKSHIICWRKSGNRWNTGVSCRILRKQSSILMIMRTGEMRRKQWIGQNIWRVFKTKNQE